MVDTNNSGDKQDSSAIQHAELGVTRTLFELDSHIEDIHALTRLVSQARHRISIYSPQLNPLLYDTQPVLDALQAFALSSTRAEALILVNDTRALSQQSHRMLALSHRLGSRIFIRKTHPDFLDRLDEFMLVDDCGYFKLPNSEHYTALCCFMAPGSMVDQQTFFNQAWEHSQTDPELRDQLL